MHHLAAINADRLAGDVRRVVRREEDRHRRDLRRRLPAPERRHLADFFLGPRRGILPLIPSFRNNRTVRRAALEATISVGDESSRNLRTASWEDGRPRLSWQTDLWPVRTAGDGCLPGQPRRAVFQADLATATESLETLNGCFGTTRQRCHQSGYFRKMVSDGGRFACRAFQTDWFKPVFTMPGESAFTRTRSAGILLRLGDRRAVRALPGRRCSGSVAALGFPAGPLKLASAHSSLGVLT